jgi:NAD(P)-dependent dehydrogenase (short-subunit alcohol dehydrogenase family)
MADGTWDIAGKTVLLTGGNAGIGKAAAIELVRRGAQVVITARDSAKGEAAEASIREEVPDGGGSISWRLLDLASFASIRDFAAGFEKDVPALHVLVHNAGLMLSKRQETEDGIEATFGTNHIGPFLLNQLLEPLLRRSAPARVVVVASSAHQRVPGGLNFDDLQSEKHYAWFQAYSFSKLANMLFTRELSRRLRASGVTANCLHPGVVATSFGRGGDARGLWALAFRAYRPFMLTPEQGARTTVFVACDPGLQETSGQYFANCAQVRSSRASQDHEAAVRLWEVSETLTRTS